MTSIATKYEVSIKNIMAWNNLTTVDLIVGKNLKVFIKNPVKSIVKEVNPVNNSTRYHYVRSGENLTSIAKKSGISLNKIRSLNPKINPNRLRVGQKIRIR